MEGQVFIESTPPPLPEHGRSGGSGATVGAPGSGAGGGAGGRENALRKVRGPAIALVAVGVLMLGSALLNVALNLAGANDPAEMDRMLRELEEGLRRGGVDREVREAIARGVEWASSGNRGWAIAVSFVNLLVGAFVAFAGVRLLSLRGRTMALFAAVISMLPCVTPCLLECICCPCCFVGIPVGVWVIATLQRSDVFDQFR